MKRLIVLFFILTPTIVFAQWSSDPANNLIIAKDDGNMVFLNTRQQPMWTSNGELFLSWIEPGKRGCLQLFDDEGFRRWSTPKKGFNGRSRFDIDNNGDAIISYSNYGEVSYLYNELKFSKIDRYGETIWSIEEQSLSQDSVLDYIFKHEVRISPQNDILTSYIKSIINDTLVISVNKINSDGSLAWPDKMIKRVDGGRHKVFYGENGGLIWLYLMPIRQSHPWIYPFQMQLSSIDKNGIEIWPRNEIIYFGNISALNTFQSKEGNCYIAFNPSKLIALSNDGQQIWEPQGVDVINDTIGDEVSPIIMGITNLNEIFIYFKRNIRNDNPQHFGQLIGAEGNRLWSEKGKQFTEVDKSIGQSEWRFGNDTVYVVYQRETIYSVKDTSRLSVCIFRYDEKPDWENSIDLMDQGRPIPKSNYEGGLDFQVSDVHNGQLVVVWSERTPANRTTVYAQNIHSDGTLGIKSSSKKEIPIVPELFKGYDPTNKILRFDHSVSRGNYNLYNTSGSIISFGRIESEVSLPDLPSGIYILNIHTEDKIESHKLFVR
jgi:hypothetical protein